MVAKLNSEKNQKRYYDFKSVEKVLKKCTKKSYQQKRDGNMHFFYFNHVRQTCFAYNFFFGAFFNNFFNGFEISVKFYVF